MLTAFASGGVGGSGGLRLSRNARFSDGEYNFPSYNPQQDPAVKKALGLPIDFRGSVTVVDGAVAQRTPTYGYGLQSFVRGRSGASMRQLLDMGISRGRGR